MSVRLVPRCYACLLLLLSVASILTALFLLPPRSFAQQLTGTLTGDVYDNTGALVTNATITMKNVASGDVRTTKANGSGHFSITAIQPGTYDITISAAGFDTWKLSNVIFHQGDTRNLAGVKLEVGKVTQTVEVTGNQVSVPLDNGEISTTLNERLIENVPLVGRDAGELIKTIPGMVFTNGLNQGSAFNDQIVGSNNGPVGAFSSNGTQPNGAVAMILDGADLVDPGNMGTQVANINQDMVSEFKALTNDYSAEYAKGPTILEFFSKSGGNDYHGEAYGYFRRGYLDSVDAYVKATGGTNSNDHYNYLGGNVGGPVKLPFTDWNRHNKKMFFWGGYEHMNQAPVRPPEFMNVPTAAQLNGDFSYSDIPAATLPHLNCGGCNYQYAYTNMWSPPPGAVASGQGWTFPTGDFDPNVLGLVNLFKTKYAPNVTPSAANNWSNYEYQDTTPVNRWEATGKVDYAFSDNTKLSVSYTRQDESDIHPIGVWWTPPWTLPYPSNVAAAERSDVILTNFTHVFNPTTTNEVVFTFARFINPNKMANNAATRGTLGWNAGALFPGNGAANSQIPDFNGVWNGAFPYIVEFPFNGGFNGGGTFGGLKKDPAIYDNFTKVIGPHTVKAGVYWDTSENIQSTGGLQASNIGAYSPGQWGSGNDTGNVVADFLTGQSYQYSEENVIPVDTMKYHQWSIYGLDTWQVNRQLTLNLGLRLDHVGQWYGAPNGFQVWDPGAYDNLANAPANTGLLWHATNSNIPTSGWKSPLFYPEPRVSFAYDLFGTGKAVIRGGYGYFRYQVSTEADQRGAGAGQFTFSTTSGMGGGYANISSLAPLLPQGAPALNGTTISALRMGDNSTPEVRDWNFGVSLATPWHSIFEAFYVANKSSNLFIDGNNGNLENLNNNIPGVFFYPDPRTGNYVSPAAPSCDTGNLGKSNWDPSVYCENNLALYNPNTNPFVSNDFRPMRNYQNVYLLTHDGYANYNSLQLSWQKQVGAVAFQMNYTFGKVLGIWDWTSNNGAAGGNTVDPFNLRNNYGPLAYDHTHLFNVSYTYTLPSLVHGIFGEAVNGWKISGYTTYQSGAPIEANSTLNVAWPSGMAVPTKGLPWCGNANSGANCLPDNSFIMPGSVLDPGTGQVEHIVANSINQQALLGTDAYHFLLPIVVCDPRKGLSSGEYFNPNCFQSPVTYIPGNCPTTASFCPGTLQPNPGALGMQGTYRWPYIKGPAYFDSDLAVGKNFRVTESKSIELRVQMTNFLNHPLPQFGLAGINDEELNFSSTTYKMLTDSVTGQTTNTAIVGLSQFNTNTQTTGKPQYKVGNRIVMLVAKFHF